MKLIAEKLYGGNVSELARKLKMKPQALAKYVKGESMPGGLVLIRIHDIGVNINWFLTGEGEIFHRVRMNKVAEPEAQYIGDLDDNELQGPEREVMDQFLQLSEALKTLDISAALQRNLLLVFTRHLDQEYGVKPGKSSVGIK